MTTEARIRGGRLAKRRGQFFEQILETQATRSGFCCIRIPDGCRQVSAIKLIRVKTPFDFILSNNAQCLFIDTKTWDKKSITPSDIEPHQINSLMLLKQAGNRAGYLVHHRPTEQVVFYPVQSLVALYRGIISEIHGVLCGPIGDFDLLKIFAHSVAEQLNEGN